MSKINFQALLDVVKATETQYTDIFDMGTVFSDSHKRCGTAGCMIGNYNLMKCISKTRFTEHSKEFGITDHEFTWLFDMGVYLKYTGDGSQPIRILFERDLKEVTKEQALSRLRKFIYYKLHKQEMIYDDQGCVRESARRTEGDHMIAKRAVESSNNHVTVGGR